MGRQGLLRTLMPQSGRIFTAPAGPSKHRFPLPDEGNRRRSCSHSAAGRTHARWRPRAAGGHRFLYRRESLAARPGGHVEVGRNVEVTTVFHTQIQQLAASRTNEVPVHGAVGPAFLTVLCAVLALVLLLVVLAFLEPRKTTRDAVPSR